MVKFNLINVNLQVLLLAIILENINIFLKFNRMFATCYCMGRCSLFYREHVSRNIFLFKKRRILIGVHQVP